MAIAEANLSTTAPTETAAEVRHNLHGRGRRCPMKRPWEGQPGQAGFDEIVLECNGERQLMTCLRAGERVDLLTGIGKRRTRSAGEQSTRRFARAVGWKL